MIYWRGEFVAENEGLFWWKKVPRTPEKSPVNSGSHGNSFNNGPSPVKSPVKRSGENLSASSECFFFLNVLFFRGRDNFRIGMCAKGIGVFRFTAKEEEEWGTTAPGKKSRGTSQWTPSGSDVYTGSSDGSSACSIIHNKCWGNCQLAKPEHLLRLDYI